MKAAVVSQPGQTPVYRDFATPTPASDENLIHVKASAISHVVKSRASGQHYSFDGHYPFIPGIDGVGLLPDGSECWFLFPRAPYGSMAQMTVVPRARCLILPEGLDAVTAAAMANPGMSAWAALITRATLSVGDTVLINGATGSAGKLAVQIARFKGAKKIVATGRNKQVLQTLGADVSIVLSDDAAEMKQCFQEQFAAGVNIVVDYLWGASAENLLYALAKSSPPAMAIRYVQVGSLAGADIRLPADLLRSSGLQMMGSGIGSLSMAQLFQATDELFQAALPGGFTIAATPTPLSEVEQAWPNDDSKQRTVFVL